MYQASIANGWKGLDDFTQPRHTLMSRSWCPELHQDMAIPMHLHLKSRALGKRSPIICLVEELAKQSAGFDCVLNSASRIPQVAALAAAAVCHFCSYFVPAVKTVLHNQLPHQLVLLPRSKENTQSDKSAE
jgi:hypothetical protein